MAAGLSRLLPATLFGRLALLLLGFVLVSHVLALTLLFEIMPRPPGPPGPHLAAAGAPRPPTSPPWMSLGLLLDIAVRLIALTVAAWIAAKWLSSPMKRLAEAAHDLGNTLSAGRAGGNPAWLAEDGPQECREAAGVFNRMRAQIQQQLDERDRFVAAVSHDLRTPLTRLRLRAESLPDPTHRAQFRRDVLEMDQMITVTLDYFIGSAAEEAFTELDVRALLDGIVADQAALGQVIECQGSARPLRARSTALKRCLGNLIDNAVRYGGHCRVQLMDGGAHLHIAVSDRGPGLPEQALTQVLEPFYRLETSRNRQHGGLGLGLSIAHDIARQHGGSLTLRNAPEGGLVADLVLPR